MYVKVIRKKNKNAKDNKKMEKTLRENERFHESSLMTPSILKNHMTKQSEKTAILNVSFKSISHSPDNYQLFITIKTHGPPICNYLSLLALTASHTYIKAPAIISVC